MIDPMMHAAMIHNRTERKPMVLLALPIGPPRSVFASSLLITTSPVAGSMAAGSPCTATADTIGWPA